MCGVLFNTLTLICCILSLYAGYCCNYLVFVDGLWSKRQTTWYKQMIQISQLWITFVDLLVYHLLIPIFRLLLNYLKKWEMTGIGIFNTLATILIFIIIFINKKKTFQFSKLWNNRVIWINIYLLLQMAYGLLLKYLNLLR